jgi:HTH-type transcriptional regulator/antitoxin HigA
MNNRMPAEAFPPGEFLKDELEERGWTQDEFAAIIGRSPAVVNQIISGKRGISPETAREIGAALESSAMYWMNLDASYRLWRAGPAPARISEEARVRAAFPVREMLKRHWLPGSENPEVLTGQVLKFFGIKSIDETPKLMHAAKKTGYPADINGPQRAWLFRIKQIASAMAVKTYSEHALRNALPGLRDLLSSPDGIRLVPKVLADCGVRFVIVEPFPGSKIDGVCFWLTSSSPVIGMSLRLDRIDNFWFVLRHEIEHVLNKDGREEAMVDRETAPPESQTQTSISDEERRADAAAAEFCVPSDAMEDFIVRHRPLFNDLNIVNFAHRFRVHPGVVVGQLQRKTGNYGLFRKHLVSVRPIITPVAMTDGYGQVIPA